MTKRVTRRITSYIVTLCFIINTVAYGTTIPKRSGHDTLQALSGFRAKTIAEEFLADPAHKQIFSLFQSSTKLIACAYNIGRFLLGDPSKDEPAHDKKFLVKTLGAELEYYLDGIDLEDVELTDDGIVIIQFDNGAAAMKIRVALKTNPASKQMSGIHLPITENFVVALDIDVDEQIDWAMLKDQARDELAVIELSDSGKITFYPRKLPASSDIFESIVDLFNKQRRVNVSFKSEMDEETNSPKKGSFVKIYEDGQTVDYAVFRRDGTLIGLYSGEIPKEIIESDEAAVVVVQNTMRANRPGRAGGVQEKATGRERNMLHLIPQNIIEGNPLEMWMEWEAPSGRRWWGTCNPFPIWPNREDNDVSKNPYHITLSRSDTVIEQTAMAHEENILDVLQFLTSINASPSLKGQDKFRIGINGWYASEASTAPKAGASQFQSHAQVLRVKLPIERAKTQEIGTKQGVTVSVLDDDEWGSGFVLDTSIHNVHTLVKLISTVLQEIKYKGDSFNIAIVQEGQRLRVFVGDKVMGVPEPFFTNEWAFAEFSRAVVVDAPELFYYFTETQREEYAAIVAEIEQDKSKAYKLKEWVTEQKKTGRFKQVHPDLFKKCVGGFTVTTAKKHQVYEIATKIVKMPDDIRGALPPGIKPVTVTFDEPGAQDVDLVGGKGASLSELHEMVGIAIPEGFDITTVAYEAVRDIEEIKEAIAEVEKLTDAWLRYRVTEGKTYDPDKDRRMNEAIQKQADICKALLAECVIPDGVMDEIRTRYKEFCIKNGGENIAVAIRSSATIEDQEVSAAGIHDSFLNVSGPDDIMDKIRLSWASLFGARAINYRNEQRLETIFVELEEGSHLDDAIKGTKAFAHDIVKMAVVVQKMIDARVSGVGFNVDTQTGEPAIDVQLNYGLGESVVRGIATPDIYVYDIKTGELKFKRLGEKQRKVIYGDRGTGTKTINVQKADRSIFCLPDYKVNEIQRAVKQVGEHFRRLHGYPYIDVELAVDATGRIYFLQARPETRYSKRKISNETQITGIPVHEAQKAETIFEGGITGFQGAVTGTLRVVTSLYEAQGKVRKGDIVVAQMTHPLWNMVLTKAKGMVVDIGGTGSHSAIVSREQEKPCVLAAADATTALKPFDGQEVTLDSLNRVVYLGKLPIRLGETVEFVRAGIKRTKRAGRGHLVHLRDEHGEWIGKPEYPLSGWQLELYQKAWNIIEETYDVKLTRKVENNTIYVNLDDLMALDRIMLHMSIDKLESIFEERKKVVEEFMSFADSFEISEESIEKLADIYPRLIAFFHIRWGFGARVLEPLQEQQLEPLPDDLKTRVLRHFTPSSETETPEQVAEVLKVREETLYDDIYRHAREYKYEVDDIRLPVPVFAVIAHIQRYLEEYDDIEDVSSQETQGVALPDIEHLVPNYSLLRRTLELSYKSAMQKEYEHHMQTRKQWIMRDKLLEFGESLVRIGYLTHPIEIFDRSIDELLRIIREEKDADDLSTVKSSAEKKDPQEIKEFYSGLLAHVKGEHREAALSFIASTLRLYSLYMCKYRGSHLGASFSLADIISVLYGDEHMGDVSDETVVADIRRLNQLVLSIGHAIPAVYTMYHMLGLITDEELTSIRLRGGLPGHPESRMTPATVFMSSGSLGQGLSEAAGAAIVNPDKKIYVIIGDGELQEGNVQEAIQYVGETKLENVVAIVDYNKIQLSDSVSSHEMTLERIHNMFEQHGWRVIVANGHDYEEISGAFKAAGEDAGKPTVIIADTVMGKGVSFMEAATRHGKSTFHSGQGALDDETFGLAQAELLEQIRTYLDEIDPGLFEKFSQLRLYPEDFGETLYGVKQMKGVSTHEAFIDHVADAIEAHGLPVSFLIADLTRSSVGGLKIQRAIDKRRAAHGDYPGKYFDVGIREQMAITMLKGMARGSERRSAQGETLGQDIVPVFSCYAAMINLILEPLRMAAMDGLQFIVNAAQFGFLSEMGGNSHNTGVLAISEFIPAFVPATSYEAKRLFSIGADRIRNGKDGRSCMVTSRFRIGDDFVGVGTVEEVNRLVREVNLETSVFDDGAYIVGEAWDDSLVDATIVTSGPMLYFVYAAKKELERAGYRVRVINTTKFSREHAEDLGKKMASLLPDKGPVISIWDGDRNVLANRVSSSFGYLPDKKLELIILGPTEESDANGPVSEVIKALKLSPDDVKDSVETIIKEKRKATSGSREEFQPLADKIIGDVLLGARAAKRDKQTFTIALETDWIPGYAGGLHGKAMRTLVQEISSIQHKLKKMGYENVEIVHKKSEEDRNDWMNRVKDTLDIKTDFSHVLFLTSTDIYKFVRSDKQIAELSKEQKPFLAVVNPASFNRFYKDHDITLGRDQVYSFILELLSLSLGASLGKADTENPMVTFYDEENRTIVYLPLIEEIDFRILLRRYKNQRKAIESA